jgi:hypothetical protein
MNRFFIAAKVRIDFGIIKPNCHFDDRRNLLRVIKSIIQGEEDSSLLPIAIGTE